MSRPARRRWGAPTLASTRILATGRRRAGYLDKPWRFAYKTPVPARNPCARRDRGESWLVQHGRNDRGRRGLGRTTCGCLCRWALAAALLATIGWPHQVRAQETPPASEKPAATQEKAPTAAQTAVKAAAAKEAAAKAEAAKTEAAKKAAAARAKRRAEERSKARERAAAKKSATAEIQETLNGVVQAQQNLSVALAQLRDQLNELATSLGNNRDDIRQNHDAVQSVMEQVKGMREEVRGLYVESSSLKGDIAQVGKQVEGVEHSLGNFRLSSGIVVAVVIVLQVVLVGLMFRSRG